jgi:hypothetical protein
VPEALRARRVNRDRVLSNTYLEQWLAEPLLDTLDFFPGFASPGPLNIKGYVEYIEEQFPPESPQCYGMCGRHLTALPTPRPAPRAPRRPAGLSRQPPPPLSPSPPPSFTTCDGLSARLCCLRKPRPHVNRVVAGRDTAWLIRFSHTNAQGCTRTPRSRSASTRRAGCSATSSSCSQ